MNSDTLTLFMQENPIRLDPTRTTTLTTGHCSIHEVGFITRSFIAYLTQSTELNIITDSLEPFEIMEAEGLQINLSRVFFFKPWSSGCENYTACNPVLSYFVNNGGNLCTIKSNQPLNQQASWQYLLYLSMLSLHLIIVAWYRSDELLEFLMNNRLYWGSVGVFSWPLFLPEFSMNHILIERKIGLPIYFRNWRQQIKVITSKKNVQNGHPHQLGFGF